MFCKILANRGTPYFKSVGEVVLRMRGFTLHLRAPLVCVCVCVSHLDYFDRQSADRTCSIKMESTRAKVIVRGKRQVFVTPLCRLKLHPDC